MSCIPEEFLSWVNRLGSWYFCTENEGRQVRLHWPPDAEFSGQQEELVRVVREWQPAGDIVGTAIALEDAWMPKKKLLRYGEHREGIPCEYPPYVPHLVCFAAAWEMEGDFASHNYYQRLNTLLGLPPVGRRHIGTGRFSQVEPLWKNLEYWANTINHGDLGFFSAISAGHFRYVGYPLAQVAFSPAERKHLREVFLRYGLTSEMSLEDDEIKSILSENRDQFRNRVGQAIDDNSPFLAVFCEEVRSELSSFEPSEDEQQRHRIVHGNGVSRAVNRLRLTCHVGLHGVERWGFDSFYELEDLDEIHGGDYVIRPGQETILWQKGEFGETGDPLKFEDFAFLDRSVTVSRGQHRFTWPARSARFFSPSGRADGLILEHDQLPEAGATSILVPEADPDKVEAICEREIHGSLPRGCKMFLVTDIAAIRAKYRQRRGYHRQRNPISLVGGLRTRRNEDVFFSYALPLVSITAGWTLRAATLGVELVPVESGDFWRVELADGWHADHIEIEARHESGRRKTKMIAVSDDPEADGIPLWSQPSDVPADGLCHLGGQGPWGFPETPLEESLSGVDFRCHPAIRMLEVLSTWGHCSYSRFRDAVETVYGNKGGVPTASRLALALHDLSHVEFLSSRTNGRWQAIGIREGALYRLPWNADGFCQALVQGQAPWSHIEGIVNDLDDDIVVTVTEQPVPWAPPRLCLLAESEDSLMRAARELNLRWCGWPEELEIPSNDAAEAFFKARDWYEGLTAPGNGATVFSPYRLSDCPYSRNRLGRLVTIGGGYLLVSRECPYGGADHTLLDTENRRRQPLFPAERQYARWLSYVKAARTFYSKLAQYRHGSGRRMGFAVPYDGASRRLALPAFLDPPATAKQTLCRCSGFLPSYRKWHETAPGIESLEAGYLEDFDSPFFFTSAGNALVFRDIPAPVAEAVVSCLGTAIASFSLL